MSVEILSQQRDILSYILTSAHFLPNSTQHPPYQHIGGDTSPPSPVVDACHYNRGDVADPRTVCPVLPNVNWFVLYIMYNVF